MFENALTSHSIVGVPFAKLVAQDKENAFWKTFLQTERRLL